MFLPVIIYNYALLSIDRSLLATMFLLFVIMIIVTAKLNNELLNQTFRLSNEKEKLINELKVLSVTDVLTNLYNRRHFEDTIHREFNRGKRDKHALNLISIDVDNFKLLNDNFGHPYGDKFLQYIAALLNESLSRSNDIIFRLGGDEFAAILSNITMKEALERCNTIKDKFNQQENFPDFALLNAPMIFSKVTLSIGLVYIPFNTTSTIANAVIAADKALYQSKQEGKNKIVLKKL
jgi:diguanylate cyclase (GGDEF)-like protein